MLLRAGGCGEAAARFGGTERRCDGRRGQRYSRVPWCWPGAQGTIHRRRQGPRRRRRRRAPRPPPVPRPPRRARQRRRPPWPSRPRPRSAPKKAPKPSPASSGNPQARSLVTNDPSTVVAALSAPNLQAMQGLQRRSPKEKRPKGHPLGTSLVRHQDRAHRLSGSATSSQCPWPATSWSVKNGGQFGRGPSSETQAGSLLLGYTTWLGMVAGWLRRSRRSDASPLNAGCPQPSGFSLCLPTAAALASDTSAALGTSVPS